MAETRPRQFETIYLAADHAGFLLKETLKEWLTGEGFIVIDGGAESFDGEDDFPDYVIPTTLAMTDVDGSAAIVCGGSGQGEAMAANRIKGARAVVYYGGDRRIITLSREHNHANVLALGSRFVSTDDAKWAVWEWLHTAPLNYLKYQRRNDLLDTN